MDEENSTEEEEQKSDVLIEEAEVIEFAGNDVEQDVKEVDEIDEVAILESETEKFPENVPENAQNSEFTKENELDQTTETEVADNVRTVELEEPKTIVEAPEVVVVPLELTPASAIRKQILPNPKDIVEQRQDKKISKENYRKYSRAHITRLHVFREFCLTGFLVIAVFAYAVLGAILFLNLEQERDITYNKQIDKWKNDTAILLATELRQVTPHEEIWARKIFHHLEIFEKDLLKASAIGYKRREDRDGCQRWSPENSFTFSMSLLTTTGFGAMTPRSDWGRTAAVCYSLLGIPLMFTCLYKCGKYLSVLWLYLFHLLCPVTDYSSTSSINYNSSNKKIKLKSNSVAPIIKTEMLSNTPDNYQAKLRTAGKIRTSIRMSKNGTETWRTAMMVVVDILLKYPEHFPHVDISSFIRDIRDHISDSYAENAVDDHKKSFYHKPVKCAENVLHSIESLSKLDRTVAIVFALLLLIIYIVFGSVIHFVDGITIEDSLYLNYLMFTTLGSGCHELDDDISHIASSWKYIWPCYLFLGYCIVSMILHLFYKLCSSKNLFLYKNPIQRLRG